MDPVTDAEVERAFGEWCAIMGVPAVNGGFRLAQEADGRVRIEPVAPAPGAAASFPSMTRRELCVAVRLLHESFNLKTQLVARDVARRRKPRF